MNVMIAGAWDENNIEILDLAKRIGEKVAEKGWTLVSGGGSGIPFAANEGSEDFNGDSIAFLYRDKATEKKELSTNAKYNVYTDMGWDGRSVLAIKSSDSLIVVGGCNGTLNEITLAYLNNIPIFIIEDSSEMIKRFKEFLIDGKYIDYRKNVEIKFTSDIEYIFKSIECSKESSI